MNGLYHIHIHIHIHTPDTGIPPHVVIRDLDIHMGFVERLSREMREISRTYQGPDEDIGVK